MFAPRIPSLGDLKKLVGFIKQLGDVGVCLYVPYIQAVEFDVGELQ